MDFYIIDSDILKNLLDGIKSGSHNFKAGENTHVDISTTKALISEGHTFKVLSYTDLKPITVVHLKLCTTTGEILCKFETEKAIHNIKSVFYGLPQDLVYFDGDSAHMYYMGAIEHALNSKPRIIEKPLRGKKVKGSFKNPFNVAKVSYLTLGENNKQYKYLELPKSSEKNPKPKHEVRGFWRKHSGIGKDYLGNYNQVNRTWVISHERGEGELIKKTKVVRYS